METLIEFTLTHDDKPGSLSVLGNLMAEVSINIRTMTAVPTLDGRGIVRFIVNDSAIAEKALAASGLEYVSRHVLAVEITDEPGSMGGLAKYLADFEINIDCLYVLGTTPGKITVVLGVDRLDEARRLLE